MSIIISLDKLSEVISENNFVKLLESQIKYPKTSEINDLNYNDCIQIQTFFNNPDTTEINILPPLLNELKKNINLKYHALNDDIIFLIKNLFKYKDIILLHQADNLIIQKNNSPILNLENSAKPNSGRSITINITIFRSMITYMNENFYKKIINTCLLFGLSIVGLII